MRTLSVLPALWFMLSTLVTLSSSRTFCSRIFFQNINETTMPYKMIEGVYIKQNYVYKNFPVYSREQDHLLFYHTVNINGVHFLEFGFGENHPFGVIARLFSAGDPTTWSSSGSLDRNDVFGGLVRDWMFYNAREQKYSVVSTSSSSPMIKAVCVDEDFRECNSDKVYLNKSFNDGRGNVLNDPTQDYFSRKPGLFRNLRPVYEHSRQSWYLQYIDGYWLVTSSYAPSHSEDQAYMRVKDCALRPEYITKTWSVHYRGWRDMPKLRVLCRGVTSNTSNTCRLRQCHGNATCVYTSGHETVCLCPYGYRGSRCTINKECPSLLRKVGREMGFAWGGTRPGDLTMSFCSGSYPSVRFAFCVDGNYSSHWSRQGLACRKATYRRNFISTENPTEDIWNSGQTDRATPEADHDHEVINFDDNPAIIPAVLTVAVLLQVLLPFVLWCCALCKTAWKEIGEEEDDDKRKKEVGGELEKKLQRVARAEEKAEQDQGIQECQRAVEEYQKEREEKEVSRKRGLYRNASLCRLFSMQLYFSLYLWLIYLVGCDLTHCTQYGMILIHLRRFAIGMLVISSVIVLLESLYSHELAYLENIMQDETAWGYIQKLHLIPPKIHMAVECYHFETRTRLVFYTDGNGNLQSRTETYQEKVVTFVDHSEFLFGSWVDVSKRELPVENWASLTRVKIDQSILFGDQETEDDFERQKEEMLERNRPRDECTEFSWCKEVPSVDKRISAFVDLNLKPFWMRPMFFWIATFLWLTWPYRWLFRAKTAKNYYTLKKKMYKSATPPNEDDLMNSAIADLVNNTSASGDCSVPDANNAIPLPELSNPGHAPYPPFNPAAVPACAPYPAGIQLNAPVTSYGAGVAVPMSSMPNPVANSNTPYPDGLVFMPYPVVPQPSAPPLVSDTAVTCSTPHALLNQLSTAGPDCPPHLTGAPYPSHLKGPACTSDIPGPVCPLKPAGPQPTAPPSFSDPAPNCCLPHAPVSQLCEADPSCPPHPTAPSYPP